MKPVHAVSTFFLFSAFSLGGCSGSDGENNGGADTAAPPPLVRVFINELQPSNQDTVTDEVGDADDWLELYNDSDVPVELQGYTFSDSSGLTQSVIGSLVVEPRAFKLIWADGSPSQGANHLGFKLSASAGDTVTLKDGYGRTVDNVTFGAATGQNSYARFPDATGVFSWCAAPTPGVSNGAACAAP